MSALDAIAANAPLGAIGAAFIVTIGLLTAAALSGERDGLAQQASDDGEGPGRG